MALFINVDPVPAKWWKCKVYRGWQFGYSGGTENDFMIDIEVAKWRFVCYIGFKKVQNWAPGYERHLKLRKEQELARKRADKPEPAYKRFWGAIRGIKAPSNRVDQERAEINQALTNARLNLAAINIVRFRESTHDDHDQRGCELAAWAGLPKPISGDAAAPVEGELLHEEHQRPAPDHRHPEDPKTIGLPKEPNA